jgi:Family of unknown function (DUF5946)
MSESTQSHAAHCPECGAPRVKGMTCWEMLGTLLASEYDDPELMAEHFLTVASYNLQHPAQFTEATLAGLRAVFIERLDQGLGIAEIRRRVGKAASGVTRVLKPQAERQPVLRQWAMTIADVYLPEQPAGAAERVRAWAAVIRRGLEPE